jgi:hypothetical protein
MNWFEPKGRSMNISLFFWLQKNKMKSIFIQRSLIVSLFLWSTHISLAQNIDLGQAGDLEESDFNRHKMSLILGHSHVPAGFSNGEKRMLVVPSWGLDYNFLLNKKWAIGLHSDFYTENFAVIDFGGKEEFVRERPITLTLVGSYNIHEKWSLMAGTGYEFAKEENLSIIRLGIERAWELPEKWEFVATVQYDLRVGVFNSWMLGLGISKSI